MERNNGHISLSDRLFAACIAALATAIMAVLAPVAILIFFRGHWVAILDSFSTFYIWGTSVTVVAGIVGFILGNDRTATLFGHLWGTEQPRRNDLTLSLWAVLIGIALVSYWLFHLYHVHGQ